METTDKQQEVNKDIIKVEDKQEQSILSKDKLNIKQLAFCMQYISNGNATQSYMSVYHSKNRNVAGVQGLTLLRKPKITRYLKAKQEEMTIKPGENKFKYVEEHLERIINDMKLVGTVVRVRALEVFMKLHGMGGENININDNTNAMDLLNKYGKPKSANDSEHIVN